MVNYNNPHTVARDFMALENLHHAFIGLLIWEIVTTLDFEWDVIRGRRPYRRTIWIYSLARITTLAAMISEMIGIDTTARLHCLAYSKLGNSLPNTAFAAASLLIVFRIIAIWNGEKIVILVAVGVWLVDVAFFLCGSIRVRDSWSAERNICVLSNPRDIRPNIIGSLIADVVLLLIMFIGLIRLRFDDSNPSSLERVLWKQGLLWLLLAIVFEIPPTVFICLDLNEPLSYIFQPINVIIMTTVATRMYRSLMDLGSVEISQEGYSGGLSGRTVSKMQARTGPIPLSQMKSGL